MADLPLQLPDPELSAQLARVLDVEGKIPRAFEALGPVADRDVVLLDGAGGLRARQLVALGARLTVLASPADAAAATALDGELPSVAVAPGEPDGTGLPDASADVVVACWSAFRGPDQVQIAEADRILRQDGRLLVLHDYGRDDVSRLLAVDRPEYTSWSHRLGPFLTGGFKIRVIHCFWTFESIETAQAFLGEAFGVDGETLGAGLRRPRITYNVAIYHRTRPESLAG